MSEWSCQQVITRLDDFVDGMMEEGERSALEQHLQGCPECRQEERFLRSLAAQAQALPREVAPPPELWDGIAARIHRRTRAGVWTRGLAAAAAVLLAVVIGLGSWPRAAERATASLPAEAVLVDHAPEAALAQVEGEYERAAQALLAQLRARQAQLPPQTVAQVEDSLRTIDAALQQIREALKQQPGEPQLHLLLASTHRRKVDVLRRVVELGA